MCIIIISHSILHQFKTLAPVLSSGAPVVLSCMGSVLCAFSCLPEHHPHHIVCPQLGQKQSSACSPLFSIILAC